MPDDPYGTRTRVTAVKGRCPRPLDEGAVLAVFDHVSSKCEQTLPTNGGFTQELPDSSRVQSKHLKLFEPNTSSGAQQKGA